MIRIRFFGLGELFQKGFRAARYKEWRRHDDRYSHAAAAGGTDGGNTREAEKTKRKEDQWTNKATTKAEVGTTHGKRNYDQYAVCWKARMPTSKKKRTTEGKK